MAIKKKVGKVVFVDKPIPVPVPGPETIREVIKEVDRPVPIVTEKIVNVEVPGKIQAISHRYEVDKLGRTRWEIAPGEYGPWIPGANAGGGVVTQGSGGGGGAVTLDAAQFAALLADIGSRGWTLDFATDQVDVTGSVVAAVQSGSWTVELGAATLAALETVTVLQGTSPWVVSGTVSVSGTVTVDTELPAAAALADDEANPTVPRVGSMNMVFDGTTWDRQREPTADAMAVTGLAASPMQFFNGATWDRARGDTVNGLDVDVTRVQGTVTVDSELPPAVALADNMANPTVPQVGAHMMVWDGGGR